MKSVLFFLLLSCPLFSSAQLPQIKWSKTMGGSAADYARSVALCDDGGYIVAGEANSHDGDITDLHTSSFGYYSDWLVVRYDADGNIKWHRCYGSSASETAYAIVNTGDGGYVVVGNASYDDGDVPYINNYSSDFFILKIDDSGNIIWKRVYGGKGTEIAYSVDTAYDKGIFICGPTHSNDGDVTGFHNTPTGTNYHYDYWVVKLSQMGEMQWARCFGGIDVDEPQSIKGTADGGAIIVGTSTSTDGDVSVNKGKEDYWVVKVDHNGNLQWEKSFGGSEKDIATSVAVNKDDEYVVTGYTYSSDGDISTRYDAGSVLEDIWTVKLDNEGNILWKKTLGGYGIDRAFDIINTNDNGYAIISYSNAIGIANDDPGDAVIFKLDNNGILKWSKAFGGTGTDEGHALVQKDDNSFAITGYSTSDDGYIAVNKGYKDLWTAQLTSETTLASSLLRFTVTQNKSKNVLKWEIANDLSIDHFTVERSNDGEKFYEIGTIVYNTASTQSSEYSFIDSHPSQIKTWYRLKTIYKNGISSFSNILFLNSYLNNSFKIYPNPAKNELFADITTLSNGSYQSSIVDESGKIVIAKSFDKFGEQQIISFDISNLAVGKYLLVIKGDGIKLLSQKFVKIR